MGIAFLCKNLPGNIFLSQSKMKSFVTSPSLITQEELSLNHLHFLCLANSILIWSRLKLFTFFYPQMS